MALIVDFIRGLFTTEYTHQLGDPSVSCHMLSKFLTPITVTITTNTDFQVIAAVAAKYICVVNISASNTSASLVHLDLREGPAGTIRYSMALAANGGGYVKTFFPWYWQLPLATDLTAISSVAVTDIRLNVDYFTIA